MRRLVAAEEAERHRVANELHDDAVQALAASVMHLGVLAEAGPAAAPREELERSGEAAGVAGEVG